MPPGPGGRMATIQTSSLFPDLPPLACEEGNGPAGAASFEELARRNAPFLRLFMRIAHARAKAKAPCSARHIFDLIRWDPVYRGITLSDEDDAAWKIANSLSPWCARLFHALHPEHDGFFKVRPAAVDIDFQGIAQTAGVFRQ